MQLPSTLTGIALLVALASGLTACSDDEKAEPEKPAPTSASPSPTATGPVPPELPAGETQQTQGGAEATVRYWFESITYAMATGDTSPGDAVATADCMTCSSLSKQIGKVARSGAINEGGGWHVETLDHAASSTDTHQKFAVSVVQPPQRLIDRNGAVIDRDPRLTFVLVVTAQWEGRWRIHEVVEAL